MSLQFGNEIFDLVDTKCPRCKWGTIHPQVIGIVTTDTVLHIKLLAKIARGEGFDHVASGRIDGHQAHGERRQDHKTQ